MSDEKKIEDLPDAPNVVDFASEIEFRAALINYTTSLLARVKREQEKVVELEAELEELANENVRLATCKEHIQIEEAYQARVEELEVQLAEPGHGGEGAERVKTPENVCDVCLHYACPRCGGCGCNSGCCLQPKWNPPDQDQPEEGERK